MLHIEIEQSRLSRHGNLTAKQLIMAKIRNKNVVGFVCFFFRFLFQFSNASIKRKRIKDILAQNLIWKLRFIWLDSALGSRMMMLSFIEWLIVMSWCYRWWWDSWIRTAIENSRWVRPTWSDFWWKMSVARFKIDRRWNTLDGFIVFKIVAVWSGVIAFLLKNKRRNAFLDWKSTCFISSILTTASGHSSTALSNSERALWVRSMKYLLFFVWRKKKTEIIFLLQIQNEWKENRFTLEKFHYWSLDLAKRSKDSYFECCCRISASEMKTGFVPLTNPKQ